MTFDGSLMIFQHSTGVLYAQSLDIYLYLIMIKALYLYQFQELDQI